MESESTPRTERESLAHLRDYVSKAVDEIVRLRAQNTALARRLSQLESSPGGSSIELAGTADPEELRTTISGFIDAIDRHLAGDDVDDSEAGLDEADGDNKAD
jgi:hypothetical protein